MGLKDAQNLKHENGWKAIPGEGDQAQGSIGGNWEFESAGEIAYEVDQQRGGTPEKEDGDPEARGDALNVKLRKPEFVSNQEYRKDLRVSVNPKTTQNCVYVCFSQRKGQKFIIISKS